MTERDLTRRKVLSGMAVAGSTGALVGHSTVSFFSDEETFSNNSIRASKSTVGKITLDVDIDSSGDKVTFTVSLPKADENGEGEFGNTENPVPTKNNPAQVWVRTKTCPDIKEEEVPGKEISWIALCGSDIDDEEVTLEVTGRNGDGEPTQIYWEVSGNATVGVVTHKIGGGPDEIYKNDVGESQTSGTIESGEGTEATDRTNKNFCPSDTNGIKYDGDDNASIEEKAVETGSVTGDVRINCVNNGERVIATDEDILDVFTNEEFRNGLLLACSEGEECLQVGDERELIIHPDADFSDVTFELEFFARQCRYNRGLESPFDEVLEEDECDVDEEVVGDISFIAFCKENGSFSLNKLESAEGSSVDWETSEKVDYVVVYGGRQWTIYEYNGGQDMATATLGDNSAAFDGELEDFEPKVFCGPSAPQSCPCEVASQVTDNGSFDGTSIKKDL